METLVGIAKVIAVILATAVVYYALLGWKHRKSHALDNIRDFTSEKEVLNEQSHMWHGLQSFDQEYASLNKNIAMSNLLQTIRTIAVETTYSISSDDLEELTKDLEEFKKWTMKYEKTLEQHSPA
jgi:hypothetical protein